MKILYLCNYFQPMNYGENEISRALTELGHKVTIVTGDRYFPFPNYESTVGKLLGSRLQSVGRSRKKGVTILRHKVWSEFAARALFFGIKEDINQIRPNVILVSGISTPAAVQAALFAPPTTRLIFIDSHLPSELSQGNQTFKRLFYGAFRLFFADQISRRANKIIAVQEDTVQVISEVYGIKAPVSIISHGTDVKSFTARLSERKRLRQKLGIQESDFVVITSGKIIPAKGVDLLFQAGALLLKKHSDIHFVVVGDGPDDYKQKCLDCIPKEYRKHIHLEGFQPQETLPGYYSMADVAVWPLQESLAMNDAISCGLPLIVNDKIGVKERISNNNALLYKQGDVSDLAKKLTYLHTNRGEGRKMGKRGRELVEQRMSWLQKAKEYIE